jgi:hypothetical protein
MSQIAEPSVQPVTLHLPDPLYRRATNAAAHSRQSIEQFLLEALENGLSLLADLPDELVDDMAALALLNDTALWRVARATLTLQRQAQLDELLYKNSERSLTHSEEKLLSDLIAEYERAVLRRAQAAVLLTQRGYDLSDPAVLKEPVPPFA